MERPESGRLAPATQHSALSTQHSAVAHLLRRAGFGATAAELDAWAALDYEAAVDRLLVPDPVDDQAAQDVVDEAAALLDADTKILDGQALWLLRMLYTQRPLR